MKPLLLLILMAGLASAHSGGTDRAGGHYNRRTGEYHFHHGHPPHDHPNGVCPYGGTAYGVAARPKPSRWNWPGICLLGAIGVYLYRKVR